MLVIRGMPGFFCVSIDLAKAYYSVVSTDKLPYQLKPFGEESIIHSVPSIVVQSTIGISLAYVFPRVKLSSLPTLAMYTIEILMNVGINANLVFLIK